LSLFLYNPAAHQWSQSFVNSKVGTMSSPNIGEFKDDRVVLTGQDTVLAADFNVLAMTSRNFSVIAA
jgi:hypothetical protein